MKRVSCLLAGALLLTVAGLAPAQSPDPLPEILRQAAEQGDGDAQDQYNLGAMYFKGESVPQDYVLVHKWINLATSRRTGEEREKYVKARDAVAEKMTASQIAEAQRLARAWKPKMQEN